MARITVEDCIKRIPNRFELVVVASKRATQLFGGAKPLVRIDNREVMTALREIAAGKVRMAMRQRGQKAAREDVTAQGAAKAA